MRLCQLLQFFKFTVFSSLSRTIEFQTPKQTHYCANRPQAREASNPSGGVPKVFQRLHMASTQQPQRLHLAFTSKSPARGPFLRKVMRVRNNNFCDPFIQKIFKNQPSYTIISIREFTLHTCLNCNFANFDEAAKFCTASDNDYSCGDCLSCKIFRRIYMI